LCKDVLRNGVMFRSITLPTMVMNTWNREHARYPITLGTETEKPARNVQLVSEDSWDHA